MQMYVLLWRCGADSIFDMALNVVILILCHQIVTLVAENLIVAESFLRIGVFCYSYISSLRIIENLTFSFREKGSFAIHGFLETFVLRDE